MPYPVDSIDPSKTVLMVVGVEITLMMEDRRWTICTGGPSSIESIYKKP
jgi:hypothetical protein